MTVTAAALRTIWVELSTNPYPVVIGDGSLQSLGAQLLELGTKPGAKVLVVSNPEVDRY
jgi:3-dehydroquinate synthase